MNSRQYIWHFFKTDLRHYRIGILVWQLFFLWSANPIYLTQSPENTAAFIPLYFTVLLAKFIFIVFIFSEDGYGNDFRRVHAIPLKEQLLAKGLLVVIGFYILPCIVSAIGIFRSSLIDDTIHPTHSSVLAILTLVIGNGISIIFPATIGYLIKNFNDLLAAIVSWAIICAALVFLLFIYMAQGGSMKGISDGTFIYYLNMVPALSFSVALNPFVMLGSILASLVCIGIVFFHEKYYLLKVSLFLLSLGCICSGVITLLLTVFFHNNSI